MTSFNRKQRRKNASDVATKFFDEFNETEKSIKKIKSKNASLLKDYRTKIRVEETESRVDENTQNDLSEESDYTEIKQNSSFRGIIINPSEERSKNNNTHKKGNTSFRKFRKKPPFKKNNGSKTLKSNNTKTKSDKKKSFKTFRKPFNRKKPNDKNKMPL